MAKLLPGMANEMTQKNESFFACCERYAAPTLNAPGIGYFAVTYFARLSIDMVIFYHFVAISSYEGDIWRKSGIGLKPYRPSALPLKKGRRVLGNSKCPSF